MSFFDSTPLGRITNRFSRDQDTIDTAMMDSFRMTFSMIISLICTFAIMIYVQYWFLFGLIPIMFLYYWVQTYYRASSREIKRLDAITRSPLFAHFSETLTGLSTIRAYRQQELFVKNNQDRMDANDRPYYAQLLCQRWLALRLETVGALLVLSSAIVVVINVKTVDPGLAGLSLSYALSITSMLNMVVRQSVDLENNLNSVERSKFYTSELKPEAPEKLKDDGNIVRSGWPQQGAVTIEDLQLRYRDDLPLVLNGLSVHIEGGQRIGIVGRTGAGKSSLTVALFRLVEAAAGRILIDGVDIAKLGLNTLRSHLAIIPQDSVLYSGTVRSNLDPFNEHSDTELWTALEKSALKRAIESLTGGLTAVVSEGGENFSVGQRCQLCLARAMLREAKILILDEATASVDMETDAFIQSSLKKNFSSTVIAIAHRLLTICDYDKVMVLSFGKIIEFDSPAKLLRNPESAFTAMVEETGPANAALLRSIAEAAERGESIDLEAAARQAQEIEDNMKRSAPNTPPHTSRSLPDAGEHKEAKHNE